MIDYSGLRSSLKRLEEQHGNYRRGNPALSDLDREGIAESVIRGSRRSHRHHDRGSPEGPRVAPAAPARHGPPGSRNCAAPRPRPPIVAAACRARCSRPGWPPRRARVATSPSSPLSRAPSLSRTSSGRASSCSIPGHPDAGGRPGTSERPRCRSAPSVDEQLTDALTVTSSTSPSDSTSPAAIQSGPDTPAIEPRPCGV